MKGRNSQEKPSIHPFHIPQVMFSHTSTVECKSVGVKRIWTMHFLIQMQNCARKTCSLHDERIRKWNLVWIVSLCETFGHVMKTYSFFRKTCVYWSNGDWVDILNWIQGSMKGCCGRKGKRTHSFWRGSLYWQRENLPCLITTRKMWVPCSSDIVQLHCTTLKNNDFLKSRLIP